MAQVVVRRGPNQPRLAVVEQAQVVEAITQVKGEVCGWCGRHGGAQPVVSVCGIVVRLRRWKRTPGWRELCLQKIEKSLGFRTLGAGHLLPSVEHHSNDPWACRSTAAGCTCCSGKLPRTRAPSRSHTSDAAALETRQLAASIVFL